jgi:hypothetical protein
MNRSQSEPLLDILDISFHQEEFYHEDECGILDITAQLDEASNVKYLNYTIDDVSKIFNKYYYREIDAFYKRFSVDSDSILPDLSQDWTSFHIEMHKRSFKNTFKYDYSNFIAETQKEKDSKESERQVLQISKAIINNNVKAKQQVPTRNISSKIQTKPKIMPNNLMKITEEQLTTEKDVSPQKPCTQIQQHNGSSKNPNRDSMGLCKPLPLGTRFSGDYFSKLLNNKNHLPLFTVYSDPISSLSPAKKSLIKHQGYSPVKSKLSGTQRT